MSKYGNRRILIDGVMFDSVHEGKRWAELRLLEKAKEIRNLRRQVPFTLIPKQYDANGNLAERECKYIADFVYEEPDKYTPSGWRTVVEDAKGVRTDVYRIKKKLMLKEYGIRIREV